MKTLLLMRHAKAAQGDCVEGDHERPLTSRGTRAAIHIAQAIAKDGFRPDLFLCSSARRTVETLNIVANAFATAKIPILQERQLYLCGFRPLLDRVQTLPDQCHAALIVGHNPDIHLLSRLLTQSGDAGVMEEMLVKFPTGACAVFSFALENWKEIAPATGRLIRFYQPKALEPVR